MTPEAAVAKLEALMAARPEFTEDDLYDAMASSGFPADVADRTFKFTQIAWGRVLLEGLGVSFSRDYSCFDADGIVIEAGQLADEPHFVAATAIARRVPAPQGLVRLALMSADVRAVNDALNAGSNAADLVTLPTAVFLAPPTPAGLARARSFMASRLPRKSAKPWWRFWE